MLKNTKVNLSLFLAFSGLTTEPGSDTSRDENLWEESLNTQIKKSLER